MADAAARGQTAAQLLALTEPATAALCFNDAVAIGLMRALAASGIAVGRAFAVIGFDDIDEARHAYPALTSVSVSARALGARAAQLLMRQIGGAGYKTETILTPTTLIVRASCGATGA